MLAREFLAKANGLGPADILDAGDVRGLVVAAANAQGPIFAEQSVPWHRDVIPTASA